MYCLGCVYSSADGILEGLEKKRRKEGRNGGREDRGARREGQGRKKRMKKEKRRGQREGGIRKEASGQTGTSCSIVLGLWPG